MRGAHRVPVSTLVFYAVLVVGAGVRIALVYAPSSPALGIDSDTSIVYLMARHASYGEFSVFFWGQDYGGTLLQLIAGAVMTVTARSLVVLVVVSVVLWGAASWFTRGIATALFGVRAGDVAGVLSWLPALSVFKASVFDPGFYGATLALALAAVWLLIRERPSSAWLRWALIGVLSGLAAWQSPLGAAIVGPMLVWRLWGDRSWRRLAVAAGGIVVGALPLLVSLHGWGELRPHGPGIQPRSAITLFTHLIPAAFLPGAQDGASSYRRAIAIAVVALLVSFAVAAARRRDVPSLLLCVAFVLTGATLIVASGVLLANDSARYAAFVYPVLAIAVAWLVTRRPRAFVAGYVIAALTTVPVVTVVASSGGADAPGPWGHDTAAVAAYLEGARLDAGYADYWFAFRFTASQQERIVLAPLTLDRYPPYRRRTDRADPAAIVVAAGQANDQMLTSAAGATATRVVVDSWAVYIVPGGMRALPKIDWALF